MPFTTIGITGGYTDLTSAAGAGQVITSGISFPTPPPSPFVIAGSSNWNSGNIFSDGFKSVTVGATSTQAGAIVITRYIDIDGTILQGTASSTSLLANTANVNNVFDDKPFVCFTISITNSSGTPATVTGFAVLLNAT